VGGVERRARVVGALGRGLPVGLERAGVVALRVEFVALAQGAFSARAVRRRRQNADQGGCEEGGLELSLGKQQLGEEKQEGRGQREHEVVAVGVGGRGHGLARGGAVDLLRDLGGLVARRAAAVVSARGARGDVGQGLLAQAADHGGSLFVLLIAGQGS